MNEDILSVVRCELHLKTNEKTKSNYQRFFKEEVAFYGVKSDTVKKIARRHFTEIKPLGKKEVFAFCEELLKSNYEEEAYIAFEWSYGLRDGYEESDFFIFEKWLTNFVNNWAKCDTLCNHTIAAFIEKYPRFLVNLKQWTHSGNRWLRRAAAVTLIIPAKEGKFLQDIFQIADSLLADKEDLVQKGYGWLLKDASIHHQLEVFDYVMKNRQAMPRTALRYAIERMPPDLKKQAMKIV